MFNTSLRPTESPDDLPELWKFSRSAFSTLRRQTREVMVGAIGIGGDHPIRLQSMTIADTLDTSCVVDEIKGLARAGAEIVRVTCPNQRAAKNLRVIKQHLKADGIEIPMVADIHFTPEAAMIAADHVEKVRINPGNYADRKRFNKRDYSDLEYQQELERLEIAFRPLVLRCKSNGVAMRIGTNHGSLSDRVMNRHGDTPLGMVESALEFVRICELHDYKDLVLSMKASNVKIMIQAYRLLAQRMRLEGMDYPFHLGVTEAGSGLAARVKSAVGIGSLLADGIGDTIRVSLTEDAIREIPMAKAIRRPWSIALTRTHQPATTDANLQASTVCPPWNPFAFSRRSIVSVGESSTRLSSKISPRIELVCHPPSVTQKNGLDEAPWNSWQHFQELKKKERADLLLVRIDGLSSLQAMRNAVGPNPVGLGLEMTSHTLATGSFADEVAEGSWSRISIVCGVENLDSLKQLQVCAEWPLQFTIQLAPKLKPQEQLQKLQFLLQQISDDLIPSASLALLMSDTRFSMLEMWRLLLATWPSGCPPLPVILRGPQSLDHSSPRDEFVSWLDLQVVAQMGSLLSDGIGDAVQLVDKAHVSPSAELAREILQGTRRRSTQADFIACPSCGRTQFDLQSTSAAIESRFKHLKGLKIAIMGCIVNGPGEMADADFGYVGSGRGRIDLYVGHEKVESNVPQEQAVEHLQSLIQSNGLWREPGA